MNTCINHTCRHLADDGALCTYCAQDLAVASARKDPRVKAAFDARLPRATAELLAQELADKHATPFDAQECWGPDSIEPYSPDVFAGYRIAPTFARSLATVSFTKQPATEHQA